MKLPKVIFSGPFGYNVETDVQSVDGEGRFGETDFNAHVIRLGVLCKGRQVPITLLHEIIHIVARTYHVEIEEEDVIRLSHGLADTLKDLHAWPGHFEESDSA